MSPQYPRLHLPEMIIIFPLSLSKSLLGVPKRVSYPLCENTIMVKVFNMQPKSCQFLFPHQILKHFPEFLLKQQNTTNAFTNHLNPNRFHARSKQNFEHKTSTFSHPQILPNPTFKSTITFQTKSQYRPQS